MPYTKTTWTQGVTPVNATNQNHLETQYDEASQSFEQDLLSAFVHSGLALTRHNSYAAAVTALANLLRYYRLDDASGASSALDSSGNNQNGTYNGAPTLGAAGLLSGDQDTAVTFASASSQRVSVPQSGLPTGNGAWTIMGWFKTSTTGVNQFIVSMGSNTSKAGCSLYIGSDNKVHVDTVSSNNLNSVATYTDGARHFACATWDGTTLSLYVDNAAAVTLGGGGPLVLTQPAGGSAVGAWGNAGTPANFFNGTLDEAAIFGAALSGAQVAALYTAGTSTTTQVDLAAGVVYPTQADSTLRRRAIAGTSFTTVTPSTTYFLYAQPDGTTFWSTSNTPAANSLALAQVTTDGSGNVATWTDKRTLATTLLPNAATGVLPRVVAQALNTHITTTGDQTILSYTPPAAGLYRVSGYYSENNGSATTITFRFTFNDPNSGNTGTAYLIGGNGASPTYLNAFSYGAGANIGQTAPQVVYAGPGAAIIVHWNDSAGTPNDFITVIIERLA